MADERVDEPAPRAALDTLQGCLAEQGAALPGVRPHRQGLHLSAQVARVVGSEEQAGDTVLDEVPRAAAVGGHDREGGGGRLLDRLAERLASAGVHEHVEAGVRAGQIVALAGPEEDGPGQGASGDVALLLGYGAGLTFAGQVVVLP